MGLNKAYKYFCKDTELQNYTKTGVKRIIKPFIFQNYFQFLPLHFLYFEKKNVLRVSFEMPPQIKQKYTLMSRLMILLLGEILKNILNACFSLKCNKHKGENLKSF